MPDIGLNVNQEQIAGLATNITWALMFLALAIGLIFFIYFANKHMLFKKFPVKILAWDAVEGDILSSNPTFLKARREVLDNKKSFYFVKFPGFLGLGSIMKTQPFDYRDVLPGNFVLAIREAPDVFKPLHLNSSSVDKNGGGFDYGLEGRSRGDLNWLVNEMQNDATKFSKKSFLDEWKGVITLLTVGAFIFLIVVITYRDLVPALNNIANSIALESQTRREEIAALERIAKMVARQPP